jgi:hypothetical protein
LATNAGKDPKIPFKIALSSYSYYKHYIYTSASGKALWNLNENPKVFVADSQINGNTEIHIRSMKFFDRYLQTNTDVSK